MVNKPLIRPYFWGGYVARGGWLNSHDRLFWMNYHGLLENPPFSIGDFPSLGHLVGIFHSHSLGFWWLEDDRFLLWARQLFRGELLLNFRGVYIFGKMGGWWILEHVQNGCLKKGGGKKGGRCI